MYLNENVFLKKYIKESLQTDRYGEPFASLIIETFSRMQEFLNLSEEQLEEDIINFINAVQSINFDTNLSDKFMGQYNLQTGQITFNYIYWQNLINTLPPEKYATKFFETFAHECLHGMQAVTYNNGAIINRAEGYNKNLNNRSHALYEIGTQAIAASITYGRDYNDILNNTLITGDGYRDEIFVIPLIAATFGVSEREVMKYCVREKSELIKLLDKNIEDISYTQELLNNIENQLDYMHSINYPDSNQTEFINLDEKSKKMYNTNAIINLIDICQGAFAKRIKNTSLDFNVNIAVQYRIQQDKMLKILTQQFEKYNYGLSDTAINLFNRAVYFSNNANYNKEALNIFSQLAKDKTGQYSNNVVNIINAVKKEDFDYCKRKGMMLQREITQTLIYTKYAQSEYEKIYADMGGSWDNSNLLNIIYNGKSFEIFNKENLGKYSLRDIYSIDAKRNEELIKYIIKETGNKHGVELKETILEYLETPYNKLAGLAERFTRNNGIRDLYLSNFTGNGDKELLSKLISDKYIEKLFQNTNGVWQSKDVSIEIDKKLQELMMPTLEKYGKEQLLEAISQVLINNDYTYFSSEKSKRSISILGRKQLYEAVSTPFFNEIFNKREISKEQSNSLSRALAILERMYPNNSGNFLSQYISQYANTGEINLSMFPNDCKEIINENFASPEGIEYMVGILCEEFSKYVRSNENLLNSENINFRNLSLIATYSEDNDFRENMIQTMVYKNPSGFNNASYEKFFQSITYNEILNILAYPEIDKAKKIDLINPYKINIKPQVMKESLKKVKPSIFNKMKNWIQNHFKQNRKLGNENSERI